MGDVIEFRPTAATARGRRTAAAEPTECRILLFTGVRYERHDSAEVEMAATQQPPSKSPKAPTGSKRRKKRA